MANPFRVLIVDDEPSIVSGIGQILKRHGIESVGAENGERALALLRENPQLGMVLTDARMPGMDGYELATHIRNDVRLRGIPIIMITSRTGEKHRQRAFEIGVDRYLGKPYQEADLMRNVDEILKVHRGDLG